MDKMKTARNLRRLLRYRGFSTSISTLFLDEQVVCGAMSCCGVLAASRTEHLLHLRHERMGMTRAGRRTPSVIITISLLVTFFLILSSYIILGFGNGENLGMTLIDMFLDDFYSHDNKQYYKDEQTQLMTTNNNNLSDQHHRRISRSHIPFLKYDHNNNFMEREYYMGRIHGFNGILKIRDYEEHLWRPAKKFVLHEMSHRNGRQNLVFHNLTHFQSDHLEQSNDLIINSNNRYLEYSDSSFTDGGGQENGDGLRLKWYKNDNVANSIRVLIIIAFFFILGFVGRRRRMRTRYALLKARAQDDQLYFASSDDINNMIGVNAVQYRTNAREDKYDGACSHTLCGCYPADLPIEEVLDDDEYDDEVRVMANMERINKVRKFGDIIQRGFAYVSYLFCGYCCNLWIQCFSVCALAQEAREARLLVTPEMQRIDLLTHQPFHEYYKDIYILRQRWKSIQIGAPMPIERLGWKFHLRALSKLSQLILISFIVTVLTVIIAERFNPRVQFSWGDAIVLIATFLQSFIVLGVVHGIFHKSDLSLDAAIKFFAAGFLLATSTSFVLEGMIITVILCFIYASKELMEFCFGEIFVEWITHHSTFLHCLSELITAFLVAAAVEEFSKYYTFRTVEHPDLIFLTGLDRSKQADNALFGGEQIYPFSSHNASAMVSRTGSFESKFNARNGTKSSHRGRSPIAREIIPKSHLSLEYNSNEEDVEIRTIRQRAAAVTTAVISCSVGLACAENFIYVFFLGTNNTQEELIMLLFRSIFPVHGLCGAMQSIGIIRKFVEDDATSNNLGSGKMVLPAIVLHGSFDCIIMFVNEYIEYHEYIDGDDAVSSAYSVILVNLIAGLGILGVMLLGIFWYFRQNKEQKVRLKTMETSLRHRNESIQIGRKTGSYVSSQYVI